MLEGSIVALVTPFDKDNNVDYKELERLCLFQIENKTNGLVILATTAEATMLSLEEKRRVAEVVISTIGGKINICAGIIGNNINDVMNNYNNLSDLKIDNYLVIDPYYIKASNPGLVNYFTYIADRVNKPVIIYNVPQRTGEIIPIDCVKALSYHKNIVGIKDASGDILYHIRLLRLQREDFYIYSGDDKTMLASIALGSKGVINVIGNAFPKEVSLLINDYNKDKEKSKLIFYKLFGMIDSIYLEPNPIGIKYLMYLFGFNKPNYRLPLCEPKIEIRRKIEENVLDYIG